MDFTSFFLAGPLLSRGTFFVSRQEKGILTKGLDQVVRFRRILIRINEF